MRKAPPAAAAGSGGASVSSGAAAATASGPWAVSFTSASPFTDDNHGCTGATRFFGGFLFDLSHRLCVWQWGAPAVGHRRIAAASGGHARAGLALSAIPRHPHAADE
ncbi:hypothetical protein ACP70R_013196 [Stipagrostis hirtigluma subsp. patula]